MRGAESARHTEKLMYAPLASKQMHMQRDPLTTASTWASKISLHNYCILHLDAQCSDRWSNLKVVTAAYKNIVDFQMSRLLQAPVRPIQAQ